MFFFKVDKIMSDATKGRVKKSGFIRNWVGGWVRKGKSSHTKNML